MVDRHGRHSRALPKRRQQYKQFSIDKIEQNRQNEN
jgi:hypothetical protein